LLATARSSLGIDRGPKLTPLVKAITSPYGPPRTRPTTDGRGPHRIALTGRWASDLDVRTVRSGRCGRVIAA